MNVEMCKGYRQKKSFIVRQIYIIYFYHLHTEVKKNDYGCRTLFRILPFTGIPFLMPRVIFFKKKNVYLNTFNVFEQLKRDQGRL